MGPTVNTETPCGTVESTIEKCAKYRRIVLAVAAATMLTCPKPMSLKTPEAQVKPNHGIQTDASGPRR